MAANFGQFRCDRRISAFFGHLSVFRTESNHDSNVGIRLEITSPDFDEGIVTCCDDLCPVRELWIIVINQLNRSQLFEDPVILIYKSGAEHTVVRIVE